MQAVVCQEVGLGYSVRLVPSMFHHLLGICTVLITSNACVACMPRVRTRVYMRVGVNCYLLQTPCFSFFLVNHASPTERICPQKDGSFVAATTVCII